MYKVPEEHLIKDGHFVTLSWIATDKTCREEHYRVGACSDRTTVPPTVSVNWLAPFNEQTLAMYGVLPPMRTATLEAEVNDIIEATLIAHYHDEQAFFGRLEASAA